MPRPEGEYKTLAGQPVPGVHDVTGRYGDKNGLIQWAYSQGKKGVPLYERGTYDIGTVVHKMCELDLRGALEREIEAVPGSMLSTAGDIDMAWRAFRQFRQWRQEHNIQTIALEESLVSETLQYGGTFDVVAMVDGVRSLIDFKTCKDASKVYLEQRVVMAAHGNLWHEKHPDMPIEAYHLINLPKDGSRFGHHAFADLSVEWHMFALQLECLRLEKGQTKKADVKRATAAPADKVTVLADAIKVEPPKAASAESVSAKPKQKRKYTRKPKPGAPAPEALRLPPPVGTPLSWGEMMRAYGHVGEAA